MFEQVKIMQGIGGQSREQENTNTEIYSVRKTLVIDLKI